MTFAEWLHTKIRERPDLNQKRVAEFCGVYASTVHFWVSGRSEPSDDNVARLAELFDTDATAIYHILGRLPQQDVNGLEPTPDEMEILSDLVELRSERVYPATVVAMKALLMVAKHEADSPFPDADDS